MTYNNHPPKESAVADDHCGTFRCKTPSSSRSEFFAAVAFRAGVMLTRSAIWAGDKCAWVRTMRLGKAPLRIKSVQDPANLYHGAAGVALFLASLAILTEDRAIAKTAVAGCRFALGTVEPMLQPFGGLYSGAVGIGLAALHVGRLCGSAEVWDRGLSILRRCAASCQSMCSNALDIMHGAAGCIPVYSMLADNSGEELFRDAAHQLGELLLSQAARADGVVSWQSTEPDRGNPAGFAHGASGMALACLELYRATGDARYKAAADGAFLYERCCFYPEYRNWAPRPRIGAAEGDEAEPMSAWCWGANGIAICRMRAAAALGCAYLCHEADLALHTAVRACASALEMPLDDVAANYGLCHGVAGYGELFLLASKIWEPEWATAARYVGTRALKKSPDLKDLPFHYGCGVDTPGLLTGLAGIGHFYLRLSGARAVSPLIPWLEENVG